MRNKIIAVVALITIIFCSYKIGHNQSMVQMLHKTEVCADATLKAEYIGDYYRHEGPTNPGGYFAHAEAFTEMIWAKCIRRELYR